MSGQPNRKPNDPADFRQDYMDALNLRAKVDDYNLQANKQYKATGALPPAVTQMTDTRNTSEILADTYKLKQSIIDDFKDVASSAMASLVVQRIEQDPLNGDGSFLQFVAQNAPEIVTQLKKKYKFGIKGDSNDVETMVSFMRNMYASIKDQTGTVKSFFDRPYGSMNGQQMGLMSTDYDKLKSEFNELAQKILRTKSNDPSVRALCTQITDTIKDVCDFVDKGFISQCEDVLNTMIQDTTQYDQIFIDLYNEYRTKISQLPKPSQIRALIGQLNKALLNTDNTLTLQILTNILSLFPTIDLDLLRQISDESQLVGQRPPPPPNLTREQLQAPYTEQQTRLGIPQPVGNPAPPAPLPWPMPPPPPPPPPVPADQITPSGTQMNTYGDLYNILLNVAPRLFDELIAGDPDAIARSSRSLNNAMFNRGDPTRGFRPANQYLETKGLSIDSVNGLPILLTHQLERQFNLFVNANGRDPDRAEIDNLKQQAFLESYDLMLQQGATGEGLKKKRRGRPVGRGIGKSQDFIETKVDKASGIKKNDIKKFVPFGKYFIHNVKLKDNIISLRQPSGVIVAGMSPTRVSDKLGHVIRTIVGGGTPKFNELNGLSDEERDYLYKVSKKSDLEDKFSVPSPSKDAMEKDIHNFEVMKGEIMAGNDSIDMIKKFKLLILKLSKNGSLPKNDVHEILQELIVLGY